jgi:membrane protein implicated in regulation of membrane protease activity
MNVTRFVGRVARRPAPRHLQRVPSLSWIERLTLLALLALASCAAGFYTVWFGHLHGVRALVWLLATVAVVSGTAMAVAVVMYRLGFRDGCRELRAANRARRQGNRLRRRPDWTRQSAREPGAAR